LVDSNFVDSFMIPFLLWCAKMEAQRSFNVGL